ncbi:MAG TPA: hypothetical protein VN599_10370, partial [Rudaea sp.]|nr:hypothetical protein [Rudaea sp.]
HFVAFMRLRNSASSASGVVLWKGWIALPSDTLAEGARNEGSTDMTASLMNELDFGEVCT